MMRVILNSVNGELIVTDNLFSWAEKNNEIARSETYTGVMITTSLEMEYGGNAFTYIKALDDEYDIAAECTAQIQYYDDLNGWVDDFFGYLDFKTIPQSASDSNTLTISAYSSTLSDKILERDSIEIPYDRLETLDGSEITPFDNEYYEVDVKGMEVISYNKLSILDSSAISANIVFPSIYHSNIDVSAWKSPVLKYGDGIGVGGVAPSEEWVNDRMFFDSNGLQGNLSGTISITFTASPSGTGVSFYVYDYKTLTPIEAASRQTFYGMGEQTEELVLDYDFDIDSRLCLYCGAGGAFSQIFDTTSSLKLISVAETTPCNFVPPIQALNRVAEAITDEVLPVESSYFDLESESIGALSFLTNGSLMRQFPIGHIQSDNNKVAQLSFTFNELYDNLNKAFNLGAEVYYNTDESRYKLRVEQKQYFYKDVIILEIGKERIEKDSYSREKDLSFYHNQINTGYNYEKPEETSALEEYNSNQSNSTPITNDNALELDMDYIGSGYVMEYARRLAYDGSETTDYKYDNDNMIFNVTPYYSTYIQRTNEGFDTITGIPNITTPINLALTPKRSFYRWAWVFNTGLRGYQSDTIKYNTSEITTQLSTQLTDDELIVTENEDTEINTLEASIFSGYINRFNAPLGSSTFKLLEANPYAIIKHWDFFNDDWAFSWIIRASNKPSDKSTNFELQEAKNIVDGDGFRILEDGAYRLLEDGGIRTIK